MRIIEPISLIILLNNLKILNQKSWIIKNDLLNNI